MVLEGVFALEAQSGGGRHFIVFYDTVLLKHVAYEVSPVCLDSVKVYKGLRIGGEDDVQGFCEFRRILSNVLMLKECTSQLLVLKDYTILLSPC